MLAELLAILSALFFGSSSVFLKKGLRFTDIASGAFFSTIVQTIIVWILTLLLVPFNIFFSAALLLFVLSGVFVSFVGVQLIFIAVDKVGVSISYPIASTSPLYATLAAVILLKEQITTLLGIGTIQSLLESFFFLTKRREERHRKKSELLRHCRLLLCMLFPRYLEKWALIRLIPQVFRF